MGGKERLLSSTEYNLVTRIGAGAFSVRIDEIISTANSLGNWTSASRCT